MHAFVLDRNRKPLTPCRMARARILLKLGRAAVFRRFPFTIILKDRSDIPTVREHRIKIDPGSKTTGVAVVQATTGRVVAAVEIEHRGQAIKASLKDRAALRWGRRQRKTRYRKPRFDNRARREGWLPPSLESRVANVRTWISRLLRLCPITAASQELVKFDLQKVENPEIAGIEYQQGTLAGYELREYLLEKWDRKCAYCGKEDVPLQIEHIVPKSKGGTNRVSNLTLACQPCNRRKGNQPVEVFLKKKPEVLERILKQAKRPLKDATAVNATRWELFRRLRATGLPIETGSGGQTKFNRTTRGLPKTHWLDAACVGASTPEHLGALGVRPLLVKACGHGKRNRCGTDKDGFPIRHAPRKKFEKGFRTGDFVRAVIPSRKYQGDHTGRVAIRFGQIFQLGKVSVHPRHCRAIHRADGYSYSLGETFVPSAREERAQAPEIASSTATEVAWLPRAEARSSVIAESVIRDLIGVRGVLNEIVVRPRPSVPEIKSLIEAAFRRHAEFDARKIGVEAHEGRVTLHGTLPSRAERLVAERMTWAAPGVSDVEDLVEIAPDEGVPCPAGDRRPTPSPW